MRYHAIVAATALALVAGCDSVADPGDVLSPDEIVALSDGLIQDGLSESGDPSWTATGVLSPDGLAADAIDYSGEFTRTHDCAFNGSTLTDGTWQLTWDMETGAGTLEVVATRTFTGCERPLADPDVDITMDGEVTLTALREWLDGAWHGTQKVTVDGSIDWSTSDGRSGTCNIGLVATVEPGTHSREVTGTVCGEDASQLGGWRFGITGQGPRNHGA